LPAARRPCGQDFAVEVRVSAAARPSYETGLGIGKGDSNGRESVARLVKSAALHSTIEQRPPNTHVDDVVHAALQR
jgi:hypothetical protein